jgi:hypothetical protein
MKTPKKAHVAILFGAIWLTVSMVAAPAQAQIRIEITTILASQGGGAKVDTDLAPFVKELESVFRYDSYQSLGTDRMSLELNQTGTAGLPGDRQLKVTPLNIQADRIEMSLEIFKKGNQIFNTRVRLRNRSSIVVGGPQHQGGYLLFRIYNQH